jgi:hypothetical protein
MTASPQGATSRISNNIDGCLPSTKFRIVTSVKPQTMRGTGPMMRTANFRLLFCFSSALAISMALTCPADRRTRNPSALRSAYPGLLYPAKSNLLFERCRATNRRRSAPKSGDDRFKRSEVAHKQQCLSMPLQVASVGHGTLSGWPVPGLSREKHRDP